MKKLFLVSPQKISGILFIFLFASGQLNAQTWNIPTNGATVTSTGVNSFIGHSNSSFDLLFKVGTGTPTRMMINRTTGNVGINTTNPLQKFHLNGVALIDGLGGCLQFGEETSGNYLWGEYGFEYWDGTGVPNNEKGLNLSKPFGSHLGSGAMSGVQNFIMFFNNDGNVGIGTLPANIDNNFKLNVCGGIKAKKIVVNATWCDYVFAENYKLSPLEEVEKFIQERHHLPEVPSAAEVEGNGADLGELVKVQMLKIEELTLYSIELNKKLKDLALRFSELEAAQPKK